MLNEKTIRKEKKMTRTVETNGKPDLTQVSTDDYGFRAFAFWVLRAMQEEEFEKSREERK